MSERIEDLQRAIEWTEWLLSNGIFYNDKFLRDRLVSMKAEMANLKSVEVTA